MSPQRSASPRRRLAVVCASALLVLLAGAATAAVLDTRGPPPQATEVAPPAPRPPPAGTPAGTPAPTASPTPAPPRAPIPKRTGDPDAEVLGGLSTLLDEDVLDCVGDRPLPARRVVDAEDDAALLAAVASLREFDVPDATVPLERLDGAAMAELVAERFGGYDADDAERELRRLALLGAVPPDSDLRRLRVEVFAAQVSGLYERDSGTASVRVGDPSGPLTPLEQIVAAHELEHALADAELGRPAESRAGEDETRDERRVSLAVVEGDAALTMHLFAALALDDGQRAAARAQVRERAVDEPLGDYPPYLRDELRFAYDDGLAFACARWATGGWPAVDALYTEPPATSAQILFPGRFADGEAAVDPGLPAEPGEDWERIDDDTLGAAELAWLFAAPGGDRDAALPAARARAGGWAGGRITTWADGGASAVGVALAQRPGSPSLCDAVVAWWTATAEGAGGEVTRGASGVVLATIEADRAGVVTCEGDRVGLGIAPDRATARRLATPG